MFISAGISEDTQLSKAEGRTNVKIHVRNATGTIKFTFPDSCSSEVALEDVARCPFVQGFQEIAEASSAAYPCVSMPQAQQRCLRAWLAAVNAGTVAKWFQVRRITTCSQEHVLGCSAVRRTLHMSVCTC